MLHSAPCLPSPVITMLPTPQYTFCACAWAPDPVQLLVSPGSAPGEGTRVGALILRCVICWRTDADFLNHLQFGLLCLFSGRRWTEQIHAGVFVEEFMAANAWPRCYMAAHWTPSIIRSFFFFFFPSHISASSHLLPIEHGMLNLFFFFPLLHHIRHRHTCFFQLFFSYSTLLTFF